MEKHKWDESFMKKTVSYFLKRKRKMTNYTTPNPSKEAIIQNISSKSDVITEQTKNQLVINDI